MHAITYKVIDKFKKHIAIFVDGDLWRKGHLSILGSKPNLPNSCHLLSDLEACFLDLEYQGAKRFAYHRLAIKNMASFELIKLLDERLVTEITCQRVIEELCQLGYMNDQDWAQNYVHQQTKRCNGPRVILQKLKAKGYISDNEDDLIEKLQSPDVQRKSILSLLKTRYKSHNLTVRYERDKVIASLQRKGFDLDIIFEMIKEHRD